MNGTTKAKVHPYEWPIVMNGGLSPRYDGRASYYFTDEGVRGHLTHPTILLGVVRYVSIIDGVWTSRARAGVHRGAHHVLGVKSTL